MELNIKNSTHSLVGYDAPKSIHLAKPSKVQHFKPVTVKYTPLSPSEVKFLKDNFMDDIRTFVHDHMN